MTDPRLACSIRCVSRFTFGSACILFLALDVTALAGPRQTPAVPSRACPAGYDIVDLQPAFCANAEGDVVKPISVHQSGPRTRG